jgi:flagellar biosynthesis/type III secretory pathway chaperone|tara:strand:- start:362 stop:628 length:267 start_codon:yes stop_codon:yes gene_type:complete
MNEQNEKELMIVEYIKSIKALEDAMEPFKEQRRELRKEYQDNGWLTREEIRVAIKAYRLMRSGDDLDDLYDMYGLLAKAKNGAVSNAS